MALDREKQAQLKRYGRRLDRQDEPEDESWRSGGAFGDTAVGLAAGVAELPSMAAGLGDIAAAGAGYDRPFARATSAIGEATGFQPSEWAENLREERYSPQMEASRGAVDSAWEQGTEQWGEGERLSAVGSIASEYLKNPRTIQSLVTESLPATVAGGFIGRGLQAALGTRTATSAAPITGRLTPAAGSGQASGSAVASGQAAQRMRDVAAAQTVSRETPRLGSAWAGAIGQAPVFAGGSMAQIDEDVDPQRAALASLGIGAGSALIAGAGAQVAARAGLVDIESAIAGRSLTGAIQEAGATGRAAQRGIVSRVAGGAAAEGVLQDLPQEAVEQMGKNWAEGEPILQGVARASVEGMLAGGVMGGAVNVRRPSQATSATDLTNTVTQREIDTSTPEREPGAPLDISGADLQTMLRYHRRLTRVAQEATQHPDLQEQALERMQGVREELQRQGVPEQVVDLELAKGRYTELQLEAEQMERQYQQATVQDPSRAIEYLEKARARNNEIQALESAYGSEALQSADLGTIRKLQEMEGTERYFRTSRGETTNRLKGRAQQRLEGFRALDDEGLARQIAKDMENAESGVDAWAPMRVAVGEERGLTPDYISQVQEQDAGGDLRRAREERQGPTPQVTEASEIRTQEDFDQATQRYDDDGTWIEEAQPAPDPRAAALQHLQTGLTEAQQRTWDSLMAATRESGEGTTASSIISRAAEVAGTSRQNLERSFRRIITSTGRAAGDPDIRTMSPQRFMDMLLAESTMASVAAPTTDAQPAGVLAEETAFTDDVGDPNTELLGTVGGSVIGSSGGSQADIGTTFDNVTRIAELQAERNRPNVSAERVQEIDTQLAALRQEADRYAEANQEFAAIDDTRTDTATEADIAAEAAQRREQLAQEAQEVLSTPNARALGRAWDKLARRYWPNESPITWEQQVASAPEVASSWVRSGLEVMSNTPQGQWVEALRSLFNQFTPEATDAQPTPAAQPAAEPAAGPVAEDAGTTGPVGPEPTADQATPEPDTTQAPGPDAAPAGQDGGVTEAATPGQVQDADGNTLYIKPLNNQPYTSERSAKAARNTQRFRDQGLTADQLEVVPQGDGFALRVRDDAEAATEAAPDADQAPTRTDPQVAQLAAVETPRLLANARATIGRVQDAMDAEGADMQSLGDQLAQLVSAVRATPMTGATAQQKTAVAEAILASDAAAQSPDQMEAAVSVTPASDTPVPTVVRTRGRRGRRRQTEELTRQGRAATYDPIEQSINDAANNPTDPDALQSAADNLVADRDRTMQERTGTDLATQIETVNDAVDSLANTQHTPGTLLDLAQKLAEGNVALEALVARLRSHPSVQNVRILTLPQGSSAGAYGLYYPSLHAIHINHNQFFADLMSLDDGSLDPSTRLDHTIAETIAHEMIHAASIRTMQENPDSPAMRDLETMSDDVAQYMVEHPDLFTDSERAIADLMLGDMAEMVTYSLTSPTAQNLLSKVPYRGNQEPTGMFGRFVRIIMDLLGLDTNQETALYHVSQVSGNLMQMDAAGTTRRYKEVDGVTKTEMDGLFGGLKRDLDRLDDGGYNIDPYVEQIMDAVDAVDAAVEANNLEGKRQALDRINRIAEAVQELSYELPRERVQPQSLMHRAQGETAGSRFTNQLYDRSVARAPSSVRNFLTDIKGRIGRLANMSMFSSDFVDAVKRHLPQVEAYFNTIFHRLSERNNMHVELQKIVDPVGNWTAAKREKLNTFLRDSTYAEAWGFQPSWINESVAFDPALRRQFKALDPDAQQVAQKMFMHASAMNREIQAQLRADIVATYDSYIEKARTAPQKQRREQEKQTALREHDTRQINLKTAYLPLKRWGEWVVVHKSNRFKQAERSRNTRELERLKQDADHYQVMFTDTEFQARQMRDQLSEELGVQVEDPFQRQRFEEQNEVIPFDTMQRLREEAISGTDGPSQAIASAVDKMYIEALAESSVRKSELRRLKVEGAGRDMVRAFVEHGQGLASLGSALKINKETRRTLKEMKAHAKDVKASGAQRNQRMQALNEVLARHAQALNHDPDPMTRKIMAGTSVWMLLTNPAYYIQNATQPFMLTYPVLSARFGAVKSMGYMRAAYSDVFSAQRKTEDGELMDPKRLTDPNEQALFDRLQRRGLLDIGIAADLGSLAENQSALGKVAARAHRKMVHAVRMVEVYNRGVTALASMRLQKRQLTAERERGGNRHSDERIMELAKQYAIKTVQTTQGDYSGPNAPRLISKIPAGRLVTQFRKFQLIQIGLLVRTMHQAFASKPDDMTTQEWKASRALGRRQGAYILGMHGMIGGAMGLPAANIIGYGLAKAFGDEDEPANAELLARRAIGDKDTADLLLRGLPARFGVDASMRLGMGLTFSIMPFADLSASRDGMNTVLANLLGPTAGLAGQFADGIGQMKEGNVAMGTAQMLPSVLRNSIRAYMYQTEGIRMRNGDMAMAPEELSWFDVGTQGLGWPGKKITDRYMAGGALRDVQAHFRQRTTQIKAAYVEAFDGGDREGMRQAQQEWTRLQSMRREYGVGESQPMRNLTRAPRERAERERGFVEGVPTQRTTRRFVESLFE